MSDKDLARRTDAEVYFDGVDISASLRKYLISLTYIDYEENESDDLQIEIEDRDDVWLAKWLNTAIQAAASSLPSGGSGSLYSVTAKSGLNVRIGPGTNYKKIGALSYGTQVNVASISNGWASITYSGQTAYISASYIIEVAGDSSAASGDWEIGDAVIANGQPQYTSYGTGTPGAMVTNYKGNITRLNLKSGVPYPIHVGYLGWFATNQVAKAVPAGSSVVSSGSAVKGLRIQAVFLRKNWNGDGKDKVLDCGQFELDSVEAGGPPSSIVIKGTALPFNSQVRQTKKNKAWEAYSLSRIANEIAALNGMTCMYESSVDPYYTRTEQITMSDIAFLMQLCHNAGISLKVSNNILVLFDQATYEAKPSVFTIKKGSGTYTRYKLRTGEADMKYASCRVSYVDPTTGEKIQAIAYAEDYDAKDKSNQTLEVTAKVSSVGEAQTLAKKLLRLKNKYEYTATFTLPGNPDLVSGVTVNLSGWGAWDGKYIINQAKHSIGNTGYTTQLRLRHVLEGY
ncbi:MAG: SH3 domain-containing protein [Sphaerochaetaceae bacterium]|nr:SH3 domain-containing protein [Sphaerochaetaceae bacterium]